MPEIQMPKLSDTMTEGTLVAWKKKKGDKVSAGDVIAEIETDKATMEWESPEDGTLTEIYVEEGGKVDVGQRIAFIGEEGRVTETDVRAAAKSVAAVAGRGAAKDQPKTAPSIKAGEGARINLSGMRKGIAERLVQSKGPIPHFYLNIDIDAGPLMAARAELKAGGEGTDTSKITVNDFVLKAAVMATVKVPKVNESFDYE